MDTQEIQEQVNAIRVAMTDKGLKAPTANFYIVSDTEPFVMLSWTLTKPDQYNRSYKNESFRQAGDIDAQLSAAMQLVLELPDADERKRIDFAEALAEAIHLGRKADIDTKTIDALLATHKEISNNSLPPPRVSEDLEIPF